jgi:hypothetical protein
VPQCSPAAISTRDRERDTGAVEQDDTAGVEQYDIRLRGRSSKGKRLIATYGSIWTVIGTNGPNVLIASPPTAPTAYRILLETGDPNFEVERLETPSGR